MQPAWLSSPAWATSCQLWQKKEVWGPGRGSLLTLAGEKPGPAGTAPGVCPGGRVAEPAPGLQGSGAQYCVVSLTMDLLFHHTLSALTVLVTFAFIFTYPDLLYLKK